MATKGFVLELSWFWILPPLIGLGIPALAALIMLWADGGQVQDLPRIVVSSTEDMKEKIFEAYQKYTKNKGIFRVRHPAHQFVMLTTPTMNELTSRPETEVSVMAELADRFNGKYSGIGMHQVVFRRAMAQHLMEISDASIPQLLQECTTTAQQEIGDTSESASIRIPDLCTRVVAKFVGVMIAGREFGHDETWLRIGARHLIDAIDVSNALEKYPGWFRPIAALFISETGQLKRNRADMQAFIKPFVQERTKSAKNEKEPTDLLQAIIDTAPYDQKSDTKLIANCLLDLTVCATTTTSDLMTLVLSDLGHHKDTQSILLEEVKQVLGRRPFHDLNQADLNKMTRLDSFLKESQRLSPISTIALARKVVKPGGIKLSNGLLLPQNTCVAVSSWSIMRDPNLWENPNEFDALRFHKLRQKPGEDLKHQFVTLSDTSIQFGAAPFACPGRVLVHNELKIVTAFLLLNYQISLNEGANENQPGALVSFKLRNSGT